MKFFTYLARWGGCLVVAASVSGTASVVVAQTASQGGKDRGVYTPNIWVDPDGCEHWVMDDGSEGFMTPHTDRQGRPVCRRGEVCAVVQTDQYFASNSAALSPNGRQSLANFFTSKRSVGYVVTGHTDSRGSDRKNDRLSLNRANAIAAVARETGGTIRDVRGFGERRPTATNSTAEGRSQNRRVEILCLR